MEFARWEGEAYAKMQFTHKYNDPDLPPNVRAVALIVPKQGVNQWASLNVKMGGTLEDWESMKAVGVEPIRMKSGLTPEKAVKLVIDWFTKNAAKLKG